MTTQYRVTSKKRKKRDRWIVQRTLDRNQVGKPFRLKAEALAYKLELDVKSKLDVKSNRSRFTERNNPIHELSVEDIDILLSDLKVFFKKLNKLKQTIAVKKK